MLIPAGILASLIVGAGMFSLPHVFIRSGIVYGFIALLFFTWVSISLASRYAKIIDINDVDKRFAGYAERYLGKKGYITSLVFTLFGILLTLTIYIALAPSFLSLIFPGISGLILAMIFWIICTAIVFLGVKNSSAVSLIVFSAMTAIIIFFGIFALIREGVSNVSVITLFDPVNFFLPFGPLLFALSGRAALSAMRESYKHNEYSLLKFIKSIHLGVIISSLIYIIFITTIIILSKQGVAPDSVTGIMGLPLWGLITIGVLGILAILDSYVLLGMEFIGVLTKDTNISKIIAYILLTFIPIIIYFVGAGNFLIFIGIAGGIFIAAESIMVILMGRRAFGHTRSDWLLIGVFVLGILYELSGLFL